MAVNGGSRQVWLHGVPVAVPDITQVKMNNGEVRQPGKFLPEIHPDNPDMVLMGMLPISEKKTEVELPMIPEEVLLDHKVNLNRTIWDESDIWEENEDTDPDKAEDLDMSDFEVS